MSASKIFKFTAYKIIWQQRLITEIVNAAANHFLPHGSARLNTQKSDLMLTLNDIMLWYDCAWLTSYSHQYNNYEEAYES